MTLRGYLECYREVAGALEAPEVAIATTEILPDTEIYSTAEMAASKTALAGVTRPRLP
jgi:hypothetical protein